MMCWCVIACGVVRLLRQTDSQIFNGWHTHIGMTDASIRHGLERSIKAAVDMLSDTKHNAIVMSGCGTSGRIAYFVARSFNRILESIGQSPIFRYTISGTDTALLESEELPEDDPNAGSQQLSHIIQQKKDVMFIGITCGLSAPFVAGQLEASMNR